MNELAADEGPTVRFWFHQAHPIPGGFSEVGKPLDALDHGGLVGLILVLNLDRQVERWELFQDQVRRHPLRRGGTLLDRCERVAAVDGLASPVGSFSPHEIDRTYSLEDFFFVDSQPMLSSLADRAAIAIPASPQEMAVAQSHLKIWQRVVKEGATTLVLEDDVRFVPDFDSRLGQIWSELPEVSDGSFDLLYLSYRSVESGIQKTVCSKSLFRPIRGLWWLSGYVLTPRGAAKLLDRLPIKGPVDQWMNHQFDGLDVYASSTPLIVQNRQWPSDNAYSIIPVLKGIRAAATAEGNPQTAISTLPPRPWASTAAASSRRRRAPVFAIGLNKTGTTSLHEALRILGYRSCHWQGDDFSEETRALIDEGAPLPFEAYTDVASIVERYQQLDRRYPSAAFILTVRQLDDWLSSRARHVGLNRSDNAISGQNRHAWIDIDPVGWRTERLMHHEAVLRYFKDRPGKLLVMDICGGDGWEDLCPFLGCSPPRQPFPHVDPLATRTPMGEYTGPVPARRYKIRPMQHDDYPWVTNASAPGHAPEDVEQLASVERLGSFAPLFTDRVRQFDHDRWVKLDDTYPGNLAVFRPGNVAIAEGGGLQLILRAERCRDRRYTSGAVASPAEPSRLFTYGRFEAEIRPARADGVVSGMFLYRHDPWQEIDLEFLGAQPDHLLINVFYNPGDEGDRSNHGKRGTPVMIELGFDTSAAFHHYAIEWDPGGMRWFVDDELVLAREGFPTPVPHLPMRFYINTWPIDAEALAGRLDPNRLPVVTTVRSVAVSSWLPPLGGLELSPLRVGEYRRPRTSS